MSSVGSYPSLGGERGNGGGETGRREKGLGNTICTCIGRRVFEGGILSRSVNVRIRTFVETLKTCTYYM